MADRGAYEYVSSGTAPDTPTPTTPSNHATGVTTSPSFIWGASTPSLADTYGFDLSVTSSFSSFVLSTSTANTTISVSSLSNETPYYWRVNGTNAYGTSSYSATQDFTTIIAIPVAPTNSVPINHATGVSTSASFEWSTVSGASTYGFQLSTYSGFDTTIVDTLTTANTISASGLENEVLYYWRTNASNVAGTSSWASSDFTTIIALPGVPVLTSPSAGALNVALTPILEWTATGATYQAQVSTVSNFTSTVVDVSSIGVNSYAIGSGLAANGTYFWRVEAANAAGTSGWSSTRSFFTILIPAAPVLLGPANGATNVDLNPTYTWYQATNAIKYDMQVSTDPTFATTLISATDITTNLYTPATSLSIENSYFWRARAASTYGYSSWSTANNFSTSDSTDPISTTTITDYQLRTGDLVNQSKDKFNAIALGSVVVVEVSSSYALQVGDHFIGNIGPSSSLTLPANAPVGKRFIFSNSSASTIVINGNGVSIGASATTASLGPNSVSTLMRISSRYVSY